jgi:ADP-L-glycero-D-manno-heptose 6-epimerase
VKKGGIIYIFFSHYSPICGNANVIICQYYRKGGRFVIIVTGGAGFIGSACIWTLNRMGLDHIIIVDHLGNTDKWKNLVPLRFRDYYDKTEFIHLLEAGEFKDDIDILFHFGACSSTTETDAGYLLENNYRYSVRIGRWWTGHRKTRLIYASSAATYGDGSRGYSDDEKSLYLLQPLNMYGYSKHLFDLYALKNGWLSEIVGLKFFNVFGPNENHKADMRSVINKAYPRIHDEGKISLFESHRDDYKHGEQRRDFIYVKDAVEMAFFFMEHRNKAGIYNIGTGIARSWNDVANAMFSSMEKQPCIDYVPMPGQIRNKYQYFTQADLKKLRNAGCSYECRSLEESVKEYVRDYLSAGGIIQEMGAVGFIN